MSAVILTILILLGLQEGATILTTKDGINSTWKDILEKGTDDVCELADLATETCQVSRTIDSPDEPVNDTCPIWFLPSTSNGTTTCKCGNSLGGVVLCDDSTHKILILQCYCISYNENENMVVIGNCLYACFRQRVGLSHYYSPNIASNYSEINNATCKDYNRVGQLCGNCKPTYAPPAYSYNLSCVECSHYGNNWVRYIAIAFLPLTIFLVIVVTFRINVTSAPMDAFIFVNQIISSPGFLRSISVQYRTPAWCIGGAVSSIFGIWNLDFFRLLYSPLCLHPNLTTLHVLILDYAVAIYPLFSIVIAYLLVQLHDNNFKIIVCLWKPFRVCCLYFRTEWNIRTSLIDAFATFLLLSCVKFLSVSFNLLVPLYVYDASGEPFSKKYLYFDGSVEYFGKEHLPYAIFAIITIVIFIILPCILLCLYPCRCFQRCLNCCKLRCLVLTTFMDAFQGCYKNGINGTCDHRYFTAIYIIMRFAVVAILGTTLSESGFPIITALLIIFAIMIAVLQPYKSPSHNVRNTCTILLLVLYFTSVTGNIISFTERAWIRTVSYALSSLFFLILLVYEIVWLLYKLRSEKSGPTGCCKVPVSAALQL